MHRIALALTALAVVGACAPDPQGRSTYVTREGAQVLHKGVGEPFEVRFKAGYSAADYWCAAGRFADYERLSTSTRIYRLTPTPRPQGSSVTFTFSPPSGGAQPTGVASLGGASDSLSALGARDQCTIVRNKSKLGL